MPGPYRAFRYLGARAPITQLVDLVEYLGALAGAIGLSLSIPQTLRIRRTGHAEGVSLATWLTFYLIYASWLAFGLRFSYPSQIFTNAFALLFAIPLIVLLLRAPSAQHPWLTRPVRALILTAGPALAFTIIWVSPKPLMDAILVLFTLVRVPQVISSWRRRNDPAPSNVSITTWVFSVIAVSLWMAYSVILMTTAHPQSFLLFSNGSNLITSLAILILEIRRRRLGQTA